MTPPRRWWLLPLVPIYACILWLVRLLREMGWLETRKLGWPVLSVGSLSVGGAGKTPVVMALAVLLSERGWTVDILSRGYGRDGNPSAVDLVDPDLVDGAARFGDEPTLIAMATGVPVWVCADRYKAGEQAEVFGNNDQWDWNRDDVVLAADVEHAHLLDDGFQHGRLARDLEIVLVTRKDLTDCLLPAGDLREPLSALQRADVVVLRQEEADVVGPWIKKTFPSLPAPHWIFHRRLDLPEPAVSIASGEPCFLVGTRPMMFCAVARPQDFAEDLAAAGCPPADRVAFRDHYRYTLDDVRALVERAQRLGLSGFVTTAKDGVKLSPAMRECLEAFAPLLIVPLLWNFVEPEKVFADVQAAVAARRVADRTPGTVSL